MKSLERFLDQVEIGTLNTTEITSVFLYRTFALQIQNVNISSFEGQTFIVDFGSVEEAMNFTGGVNSGALILAENAMDALNNATAAIHIPKKALEYCTQGEKAQRLSHSVFLFDTFFRSQTPVKKIGSLIIGARLQCGGNGTLPMAVSVTLRSSNNVGQCNYTA